MGQDVGGVGGEQRQQQLEADLADPGADQDDEQAGDQPDGDTAEDGDSQLGGCPEHSGRPTDDGLDGYRVKHQGGGVVDEALPLDDVDHLPGCPEPAEDP